MQSRDTLISKVLPAAALAASAAVIAVQYGRFVPLVDFTYQLESAYRIYSGQVPYKDFFLVLPPGGYWVHAVFMKLFGPGVAAHLAMSVATAWATIILSYCIVLRLTGDRLSSGLLMFPLVFTVHAIYPFPVYDNLVTPFILLSLWLYLKTEWSDGAAWPLLSGAAAFSAMLVKLNTGIVFFFALFSLAVVSQFLKARRNGFRDIVLLAAGFAVPLCCFAIALAVSGVAREFLFQCIEFPAQTRPPAFQLLYIAKAFFGESSLAFYAPYLLCALVLVRTGNERLRQLALTAVVPVSLALIPVVAALLLPLFMPLGLKAGYFYHLAVWHLAIAGAVFFLISDVFKRELAIARVLPAAAAATALASFMAQGVIGSTYGIWPLLIVMIASFHPRLKEVPACRGIETQFKYFAVLFAAVMLAYLAGNVRMTFISLAGGVERAEHPRLKGVATPGPWLSRIDALAAYAEENIPRGDPVATLPGEDPFYYVTGRKPAVRYIHLNGNCYPADDRAAAGDIIDGGARWLILKTELQSPGAFRDTAGIMAELSGKFALHDTLPGYEIYKRTGEAP